MGLAASVGKDNDELVDNLIDHESLKTELVEKVMRLVDRGRFMPEDAQDNAYKDSAWKSETGEPGFLHISAPCIYSSVLENLDLDEGMAFLNIGSGTGYLSTMVGFMLGESGTNHGVELYENIVNFANERVIEFLNSKETSSFEWCAPYYFAGNAFQIEAQIRYDRIYCGALVPESHRAYFCSFLKIGGVIIMPYGHSLQRITRQTETMFNTRDISAVTFSHLIPVNPENLLTNCPVKLPLLQPISLQQSCRKIIRKLIRRQLLETQKVEMRNHILVRSNNKKGNQNQEENPTNKQEEEHGTDESPRRTRRPHLTLMPRRLMDHPVVLFEEREREEEETNEPGEGAPNQQRRMMPVRQLFAMFARERLRRHHAARARQAAELLPPHIDQLEQNDSDSGGSSAEEEIEEIHNIPGQHPQPQQFYNGPDDNSFGFQFVAEEDIDVDDGINLNDLLEHFEGQEERDASTNINEEIVNEEENGKEQKIQIDNDTKNGNGKMEQQPADQSVQDLKAEENIKEDPNSEESSSSFITAFENEDPPIKTIKTNDDKLQNNRVIKSGINKRPRQRTYTTSSLENAPHASKIQRKKATFEVSTSQMEFIDEQATGSSLSKNNVGGSLNSSNKSAPDIRIESADSTTTSIPSSSHSNSSCSAENDISFSDSSEHKLKEESNVIEIKAEQQNYQMHAFHMEFYKCIDSLPLTVQMRNYLKFGL